MIKVISYNIHFGKKLDKITEWIKSIKPKFDVLCFQEFPAMEIENFLKNLKPLQLDYAFSVGIMKGKKQYGQLTLVNNEKIRIIKSKEITLGHARAEKRIFRHKSERTSLITVLKYGGEKIVLANVHLACLALNALRRKQINKIVESINEFSDLKNSAKILVGDFNYSSLIKQKQFFKFMEKHNFVNAYKFKTYKMFKFIKHQLDYTFYMNSEVKNVKLLKINYSDHYPILFTLLLPKNFNEI